MFVREDSIMSEDLQIRRIEKKFDTLKQIQKCR